MAEEQTKPESVFDYLVSQLFIFQQAAKKISSNSFKEAEIYWFYDGMTTVQKGR